MGKLGNSILFRITDLDNSERIVSVLFKGNLISGFSGLKFRIVELPRRARGFFSREKINDAVWCFWHFDLQSQYRMTPKDRQGRGK